VVKVQLLGRRTHVGYFADEIEAAQAYDRVLERLIDEEDACNPGFRELFREVVMPSN
jgi:hypothetical protein